MNFPPSSSEPTRLFLGKRLGAPSLFLLLALAALLPAAAPAQTSSQATALNEQLKKIAARYARTEERINYVVGRRREPRPLPAELPNPFYRGVEASELASLDVTEPAVELAPAAPDITDADTLARVTPTLRITGLVVRGGQPHLIINSVACKVGDVFAVGGRDVPLFLQLRKLADGQVTFGLNDAELTIPLKL